MENLDDGLDRTTATLLLDQDLTPLLDRLSMLEEAVAALTGKSDRTDEKVAELRIDLDNLDRKSPYFSNYSTVEGPKDLAELETSLEEFVRACAELLDPIDQHLEEYVRQLKTELRTPAPAGVRLSELENGGCRMWTCDHALHGRTGDMTVYGSLTKATRENNASLMRRGGMRCIKALHSSVVRRDVATRLLPPSSLNWDKKSHRGAGIRADKIAFWKALKNQPGHRRKYRIPMLLASSLLEVVGKQFLERVVAPLVKVHFILYWPDEGCVHGVYIDAVSACQGEAEMLLAAFSAVELIDIDDSLEPIQVSLKVLPDNKLEPEYLPVADWH